MVRKIDSTYHQLLDARFQDTSQSTVEGSINLAVDLYVDLLSIFHDPTQFDPQTFMHYPMEVILDYLRQTHQLYLRKSFTDIEAGIESISSATPTLSTIKALSRNFFFSFRDHLQAHIKEEEQELFPYIDVILRCAQAGEAIPTLALQQNPMEAMANHNDDLEDDLGKFIQALEDMHNPHKESFGYRMLITRLKLFELDLRIHGRLEDEVLIPQALQLQSELAGKNLSD